MKKCILFLLLPALLLCAGCAPLAGTETTAAPAETTAPAQTAPSTTEAATIPTETDPPASEAADLAPDFTVCDKDGNPVSLYSLLGKPVVLNFWASWCGPCKSEMPEFDALYQELGDEVTFMMINVTTSEESKADPEQLIADLGYTFPVYYDLEGEAVSVYGVSAFPTTFFIGAGGEAVAYAVGAIDGSTLRRGIEMTRGNGN